jgi:hypothetical protein
VFVVPKRKGEELSCGVWGMLRGLGW